MPAATQNTTEPPKPSHDFFGLIRGAIGCLPNSTPAAYPPTSLHTAVRMNTMIQSAPSSLLHHEHGERDHQRQVRRREQGRRGVAQVALDRPGEPPQHGDDHGERVRDEQPGDIGERRAEDHPGGARGQRDERDPDPLRGQGNLQLTEPHQRRGQHDADEHRRREVDRHQDQPDEEEKPDPDRGRQVAPGPRLLGRLGQHVTRRRARGGGGGLRRLGRVGHGVGLRPRGSRLPCA